LVAEEPLEQHLVPRVTVETVEILHLVLLLVLVLAEAVAVEQVMVHLMVVVAEVLLLTTAHNLAMENLVVVEELP
jgi:hypothetical protein